MNALTNWRYGMRSLWCIYWREMLAYFVSPIAYIILFVFLLANGITFNFYLNVSAGSLEVILHSQYGAIVFWFLTLLIPPLLTMRMFAEEHRSGTYEALITTGISETTLVVAKWLASWTFFVFLWVCFLPVFVLMEQAEGVDLDWGMIWAVHAGLALLGGLFSAIGIFASTFTRNQLVAASVAIVLDLMIFFLNYFRFLYEPGDLELRFFQYISPLRHFAEDFTSGVFDFRYVTLYISVSALFLFLGVKVLERRRWW